jgi:predicted anti-sigma-YlaC factor YlaD
MTTQCYDCRTTDERLADLEHRVAALEGKPQPLSAVDALRQIANIQARDPDGLKMTWSEMALTCIDIARKALDGA